MSSLFTIEEIEKYLSLKNEHLDNKYLDAIEELRQAAINEKDEECANYCWCLKQIYTVQNKFLSAFYSLQSKDYEKSWVTFDEADINLGFLVQNFDVMESKDKYHMAFIGRIIKNYQKLYPYHLFFSRESVIKEEKCSICGKVISLRKSCGHKLGKLYMGEMCFHEVTDIEFKALCVVTDPFDKYTYLKIEGKEYNYEALDMLMAKMDSPFDDFIINTEKTLKPEFKQIGRNDKCPCGSGKKYKKCHWNTDGELMDHLEIVYLNKPGIKPETMRCINTIKNVDES